MINRTASYKVFNTVGYIIIILLTVFCLLPFLLVISGSLSDNDTVLRQGYSLIPRNSPPRHTRPSLPTRRTCCRPMVYPSP